MPESSEPARDDAPRRSTLDRFLSGLSEYIFQTKLGVADVQLVQYVSDLMLRFTRVDAVHRMRRSDGTPATEVFQLLSEAERRIGTARREVHRHIGDVTLFWSGMFPESVRGRAAGSPDQLLDYFQHGKRSYKIASTIQAGQDRPPCDLMDRLSEQFELCAYGLREVRREWEESDPGDQLLI